jgi:hypothetical protein
MIMLLADSVSEFFINEHTYSPFGKGPWDCHNSVCSQKTELTNIGYSRRAKERYGEFLCQCGYKERRYMNGKNKVIEFGEVWEKKLIELVQQGQGITYISNFLKADKQTIKKYAKINNVTVNWAPPRDYISRNQKNNKVNHYDIWLKTSKENAHLNMSNIRKIIPATYIWLYRNDRQFLIDNSQPSIKPVSKSTVDWNARDKEMLKTIKLIVENWDKNNQKPERITKTSIAVRTHKKHWLEKLPKYFPKTIAYIESVVETIEEFQMRRVKWLLNNHYYNEQVKEWVLYRKAGLTGSDASEKVKLIIRQEVMEHNIKVSKVRPENGNI